MSIMKNFSKVKDYYDFDFLICTDYDLSTLK